MKLSTPKRFYDQLRSGLLGPKLEPGEVDGLQDLLTALAPWPAAWAAYGLATAYHETAHTLQPVREIGSEAYLRRMYDKGGLRPKVAAELGNTELGDGVAFCGRGYVQLTGRGAYARADAALGLEGALIAHPDLALEPAIAAKILERGMREGWFSGRKLGAYLSTDGAAAKAAFTAARRVINGQDRAGLVADYAVAFQDALLLGGWA